MENSEEDFTLDDNAKKMGIRKITENEDGSVTIKTSKKPHKKLVNIVKESMDDSINEILEDKENYPSFNDITYNDNLTEFILI